MTRTGKAMSRHVTAALTWVAVYPVITLLLHALGSALAGWPLPLRTLVLTAIMVPVTAYVAMPAVMRVVNKLRASWCGAGWTNCRLCRHGKA